MQILSELISEGVTQGVKRLIDKDETCPIELIEDFVSFNNTTGQNGITGWNFSSGAIATVSSPASHPGVFTHTSGAVANTVAYGSLGYSPFQLPFWFAEMDYMVAIFRLATTTLFNFRVGLSGDWSTQTPSNAVYIEKLAADTTFFGVCRNSGGTQTRSSAITGTIAATTWYKIKIRRISSTSIGFSLSVSGAAYGTEVTVSANVPDVGGLAANIGYQITPTTAAAKACDIDFMKYRSITIVR